MSMSRIDPQKYLRQICFVVLLFALPLLSFSQQVTWGLKAGAAGIDYSEKSCLAANGNILICGEFRGSNVDFDPSAGTALHSSNGASDGYVAEYTSDGQYVLSFTIGGGNLDKVTAITTDPAGNIYITGFFRGANVDFDPSPAKFLMTSNGDAGGDPGYGGDIFVARYSPTGQFIWAFHVGSTSLGDSGLAIAADASGNIFVGGYFFENIDFDPSPAVNKLNAANGTLFLARYNTNGQYQWAFSLGMGNEDNTIFDLKIDAGNIYITGFFQGKNIDFDPSAGKARLSSSGNFEAYVAKYNFLGQYQFAFKIGGPGLDTGRGIALDDSGNIYVIGDFNGANVDFDPSAATALVSSNGSSDVFVAKYTNTGQYVWAFNAGSRGAEYGVRIATDNASVFVTGGFSGVADFNPSAAVDNLTSNGGADIFLAKYDVAGHYQCAFNLGSSSDDYGRDIVVAGNDRFYLSGGFKGANVDFVPTASTFLMNSAGGEDIFLAKYFWPANTLPTGTIQGNTVCNGGTGQLVFTATAGINPFTVVYTDGITNYTQPDVQSGVPFNVQVNPTVTTTYSLVSIQDGVRCSPSNNAAGSTTAITVCGPDPVYTINEPGRVRLKNVFFDFDTWNLRPESYAELDKVVKLLKDNPAIKIEISAHTDDRGSDEYNYTLSENRAKSVMEYILSKNIAPNRLSSRGYGETKPFVPNDTEEHRQLNRRVEYIILKN
jgi:outer membrane protein OmpA-like peptidoglycan-associated protein